MNSHLQPWSISAEDFPADGYASDQLQFLLGYAILAPSNHNTQPWLFRINAMDIECFGDPRRRLPTIDPEDRELTMSCAAALFNVRVAAEYFGHQYKYDVLPEEENPGLLARFCLGLKADTSSEDVLLFYAITQRRTNRSPFDDAPIEDGVIAELEEAARREGAWLRIITAEESKSALADLIAEADRIQRGSSAFRKELASWVRPNETQYRDGLPARSFGILEWLSFAAPAILRTFDRGGGAAARDRDIAQHSPALAVLGTEADDRRAWMTAGQAMQSVLLQAQAESVCASFLNQPIEVADLRPRVAELAEMGGTPQILLRLGHGPQADPSPRRGVREVIIPHKTH
jgi:nitroreductase